MSFPPGSEEAPRKAGPPVPPLSVVAQALGDPALVWGNSSRRNSSVFRRSLRRARGADLTRGSHAPQSGGGFPLRGCSPFERVYPGPFPRLLAVTVIVMLSVSRPALRGPRPAGQSSVQLPVETPVLASGVPSRVECHGAGPAPRGSPPLQGETRPPCPPWPVGFRCLGGAVAVTPAEIQSGT